MNIKDAIVTIDVVGCQAKILNREKRLQKQPCVN